MKRTKTQAHGSATRAVALAAVLSVALAMFAGAAQAGAKGFTGVVNPFFGRCADGQKQGDCLSSTDLGRMHRAHVATVRWGFRWNAVEPTKGVFNWRVTDQTIGALANSGSRVLPVVNGTPPWAGATFETPPLKTRKARAGWRDFLKAAVERYGPGGRYWTSPYLYRHEYPDGSIRPINTWQIWNEQNNKPAPTYIKPGKYRRLVGIAHDSIVKADPKATILLGGMPGYVHPRAWGYLKKLYKRRSFKHEFDAVALHPYSPDVKHVLVQIKHTRKVMKKNHDSHASLWITELGWGSKRPSPGATINKGPQGQKRLLQKTFPRLQRHRRQWNLKHAFWYTWRDPPRNKPGCSFCSSSGLFKHSQKPKPAWKAFKHITKPRR